jgi:hypothetical protein
MIGACKLASTFLQFVVKHLPVESQPWGRAMLREMDFIETPWGLLSWVIGGICVLFAYSVRLQFRNSFRETLGDIRRSGSKRTIAGLLSGLAISGILLGLCLLGYRRLEQIPRWQLRYDRLIDAVLVFLLPEAVYLLAVTLFWRRRRSAALGILLAAVALLTHVLVRHLMHS